MDNFSNFGDLIFFGSPSHFPPIHAKLNHLFQDLPKMDAAFYFSFYEQDLGNDDEPTERHLGFYVTNLRPWDEIENDMYECEEQLGSKFGMHNWLVSSAQGVTVFGYGSYEVDADQHDELMELWRKAFFHMSPGCVVGEVFPLTIGQTKMHPAHIFQHAKDTYEQQQAQKLHHTLTDHVRFPPATASKKM